MRIIFEEVNNNDDKQYIKDFVKNELRLNNEIDVTDKTNSVEGVLEITDSDILSVVSARMDKLENFESSEENTTLSDSGWVKIYNQTEAPYMSVTVVGDYENDYNKIILFINKSRD